MEDDLWKKIDFLATALDIQQGRGPRSESVSEQLLNIRAPACKPALQVTLSCSKQAFNMVSVKAAVQCANLCNSIAKTLG